MMNTTEDRALSEHRGSCLMSKKANGLYSLFIPSTGTGENGSAPETLEKTVLGNKSKTYEEGRTDNPAITLPYYNHRDNKRILNAAEGKITEFMRVFPDYTGYAYSAKVSKKHNDTTVGSLEQGEATLTVTSVIGDVDNIYDLIQDTVKFTESIEEVITLGVAEVWDKNLVTDPAEATIVASEFDEAIATCVITGKALKVTGVAKGSTVLTLTASEADHASFNRTILIIVE